jgi:RecB family endonuclease NucS
METMFKNWLLKRGNNSAANSYPKAIHLISKHYSKKTGTPIDIYKITDQSKISALAHDYSQSGKFSDFGYEQHGRFRAAMKRYSDFFVQSRGEVQSEEYIDLSDNEKGIVESTNNFAYEKDLQTALCSQITELFPGYKIYGGLSIGVEYSIGGRRIDALLEHENEENLLVVELKSGVADFKVFGQISMYMGLLQRQFPEKNISGVIVAGSIDESLVPACETSERISLKTYRMSIELEDA